MIFSRRQTTILILLYGLLLTACTTTPTPNPPQTQTQTVPKTSTQQDPLQTAEHWLKTGLSTQNLPVHTDFWTQTQSWNSPRVTRLYLSSPNEYHAIITDQNESPNTPTAHALLLTITHQTITQIQQTPTRHLWPRF